MSTTIPFSYYLYHIPTGLKYYGVRYSNGCSPTDIWTTYFTSSLKVKQLISEYGVNSFKIEVRKTFQSAADALLWEHKVLRRLNAASSDVWINQHNGDKKFRAPLGRQWWCKGNKEILCIERPGPEWIPGRSMVPYNKGKVMSTRGVTWWHKDGKSVMRKEPPGPDWQKGTGLKGTPKDSNHGSKISAARTGKKWWNKDGVTKSSKDCPGDGWTPGRVLKNR